jgi:threonine/homoserine efflux transporter RhtA
LNGVIGDILPLAIGVAISPIPIIAAILMLLATGLFTALAGSLGGSDQPTGVSWTKIGLGALLLIVGLRQWRGRHDGHGPPKWMAAIDRMGFGQALGLGFALPRSIRRTC